MPENRDCMAVAVLIRDLPVSRPKTFQLVHDRFMPIVVSPSKSALMSGIGRDAKRVEWLSLGRLLTEAWACHSAAMDTRYEPASDFLNAVVADEIPLSGSAFANNNFHQLLAMMKDEDRSNRDWATMLVAQQEIDSIEVRNALLDAARDGDDAVRAEAILGLAQRDHAMALPLIKGALSAPSVLPAVFEAAALVADRSLVGDLRQFVEPSDNAYADQVAAEALAACENGSPRHRSHG